MLRFQLLLPVLSVIVLTSGSVFAEKQWVTYEGKEGPGKGKHIVLISGDEEYRSEEALPQLGKILAVHHGFKCTVLFSINPDTGEIDPTNQKNIPGLHNLVFADLVVIATRFRNPPDKAMKYFVDYVDSGKPIIGLRTATHSFNYGKHADSMYKHYSYNSGEWKGGFGRQVLGDTWISHHGKHKKESTRGVINEEHKDHPILKGVKDVWGPTDVYGIRNLVDSANVLLKGQVLTGMKPTDPPVEGKKNDPMMPLAWTKGFKSKSGKESRIFCTTMGASIDLESEDLRRLIVNAAYWCLEMDDKIPAKNKVDIVGEFKPTFYGFGSFQKGVKPEDHEL